MLSDKIWITRKTRIYTEQRLIRKNFFSQMLIIFYSCLLLFLTIWNLKYPNENINLFLVIGSIAVLITSISISSQKYIERSYALRNCYLNLDELYSKVKRAEISKDYDHIQQYESEYTANLLNVENHSDYDYLCFRYVKRNDDNTTLPRFVKFDYFLYYCSKFWRFTFGVVCFLLPFIIFLFGSYLI